MRSFIKRTALAFLVAAGVAVFAPSASAQVSVNIGPEPACPYGYYDAPPYNCAPYGYYGPQWFAGGAFLGAGPWFHGPRGFYGSVDNRYDAGRGYRGPLPQRNDRPVHDMRDDRSFSGFHGNEERDGHGGHR